MFSLCFFVLVYLSRPRSLHHICRASPCYTSLPIITVQYHRNPGIYRDKTMAVKLMYIPNDNTHNYPFCKLRLVSKPLEHTTK